MRFRSRGQPVSNIVYRAKINADTTKERIHELMLYIDSIAEIQTTLRFGMPVKLEYDKHPPK
jgi:hypothetical protein